MKCWLGIFVLFIFPVICNILVLTHCSCFVVAGKGTDWLMFFGSYFGGAIAAVTSFVILWYNRQDNQRQQSLLIKNQEWHLAHEEIVKEIQEIAGSLGKCSVTQIINLDYLANSSNPCNTDLFRLQTLYETIQSLKISAQIWFDCDMDKGQQTQPYRTDFYQSYKGYLEDISCVIAEVIKNKGKATLEVSTQIKQLESQKEEILKRAQAYIKCRIYELNKDRLIWIQEYQKSLQFN